MKYCNNELSNSKYFIIYIKWSLAIPRGRKQARLDCLWPWLKTLRLLQCLNSAKGKGNCFYGLLLVIILNRMSSTREDISLNVNINSWKNNFKMANFYIFLCFHKMWSLKFSPSNSSVRCFLEAEAGSATLWVLMVLSALLLLLSVLVEAVSVLVKFSWMNLIDNCVVKTEVLH